MKGQKTYLIFLNFQKNSNQSFFSAGKIFFLQASKLCMNIISEYFLNIGRLYVCKYSSKIHLNKEIIKGIIKFFAIKLFHFFSITKIIRLAYLTLKNLWMYHIVLAVVLQKKKTHFDGMG